MKYTIILLLTLILISGCIQQKEPTLATVKLTSITGGDFVPSAGYYEGNLILSDTISGEEHSIFICSQNWDWVKKDSCYKFDSKGVNENIEQHKYSAQLSGCYVGTLEQVGC